MIIDLIIIAIYTAFLFLTGFIIGWGTGYLKANSQANKEFLETRARYEARIKMLQDMIDDGDRWKLK